MWYKKYNRSRHSNKVSNTKVEKIFLEAQREEDGKSLNCTAVHVNNAFKENTIIYGNVVDYGSVHLVEIAKWSASSLYESKRCTHLFIHALTETAFCSLIFVGFFNDVFFLFLFSIVRKSISPKLYTNRRKMKHFNYIWRVLQCLYYVEISSCLDFAFRFSLHLVLPMFVLYCVLYAFFTKFSNVIVGV